jgi:predicted enzyme involved in methoxymalonyl-ACP biosynthesis
LGQIEERTGNCAANFFWNLIQKGFQFKLKFESFQKPEIGNLIKDSNQEILKFQAKDNLD